MTGSTAPVTRMLAPEGSTNSRPPIVSGGTGATAVQGKAGGGSGTTSTGATPNIAIANICLRQVQSRPVLTPCRSATVWTSAPGSRCEAVLRAPRDPQPVLRRPVPAPDSTHANLDSRIRPLPGTALATVE